MKRQGKAHKSFHVKESEMRFLQFFDEPLFGHSGKVATTLGHKHFLLLASY